MYFVLPSFDKVNIFLLRLPNVLSLFVSADLFDFKLFLLLLWVFLNGDFGFSFKLKNNQDKSIFGILKQKFYENYF